jgi:hypothetical protein
MIQRARFADRAVRRSRVAVALLAAAAVACTSDNLLSRPDYAYVKVIVQSSGADMDIDRFTVVVDALQPRRMSGDTLRAVDDFVLSPGTHAIRLDDVAANCAVKAPNPRIVTAVIGQVAEVAFEVVCIPTGLAVTTHTTGPDSPDALSLIVNEQPPITVSSNGLKTIGHLSPGSYSVTLRAPSHCSVSGGGRFTIAVAANAVTPVPVDVTCTTAARLEKIAYVTYSTIGTSTVRWIGIVNADGTGAETLRPGDAPTWSPARTQLAYSTTDCYDYDDYGIVCTGGLRLLDPETGNFANLSDGFGYHPSWGRSGSAIAFEAGSNMGTQELAIMKLPSRSVTPIVFAGPLSRERPSLSPDEKRIAFTCKWGATVDICIVNADGTGLVRLTDDVEHDDGPAWNPDGTSIAFSRHPVGGSDEASSEIVVMDLARSKLTTLTTGTEPAWSPDGSRLVFAGSDGLFVIGADGTGLRRLTTGAHHAPAWRP